MNKEKRKYTRQPLHTKANLKLGCQSIDVESENLSLSGVFVTAVAPMDTNDAVAITIGNTPISAKAKVVRVTDIGMGLQFKITLLD